MSGLLPFKARRVSVRSNLTLKLLGEGLIESLEALKGDIKVLLVSFEVGRVSYMVRGESVL